MKLIVAGGRDYELTARDYNELVTIHHRETVTEVVSGACPTGADKCGEVFAAEWGIPVRRFPADWDAHGRAAGPIRNKQMAEYADAVALFHGGRGTASMRAEAERAGIKIYDFTK